jgi:NAD(P)-dependent dehydrogenase (short-subunit alcohol dehydrogenase family)
VPHLGHGLTLALLRRPGGIAAQDRVAESLPMKRLGTGDDVAAATAFLASQDASFITGVALPVDGGRSAGGA